MNTCYSVLTLAYRISHHDTRRLSVRSRRERWKRGYRRLASVCTWPVCPSCKFPVVRSSESVCGRGVVGPGVLYGMQENFKKILGDRDLRTSDRARVVGTHMSGGVAFERSIHAVSVNAMSPRCYTLGQSHQHSRSLVGPTMGAKVYGTESDHHALRRDIMKVCHCLVLQCTARCLFFRLRARWP